MLFYDCRQKEIYDQWFDEYVKNQIAQARAIIETNGLSEKEGISFFLMSQQPLPSNSRSVTEQIFRWCITVTQFIAIQKSLKLQLYNLWGEDIDGNILIYDVFISNEDISMVENKFPELKKTSESYQEYIDALNMVWEGREIYDFGRNFWGKTPVEINIMRDKIFEMYKFI